MSSTHVEADAGLSRAERKAKALKAQERHDYDMVAPFYDANTTPLTDVFGIQTVEAVDLQPGHKVLEVTCGSGTMIPQTQKRIGPTGELMCFDQSEGMLGLAQKRAEAAGYTNCKFVQGDFEVLAGVPDGYFDRAFSVFGLMYLPKPLVGLTELKKKVKPGGKVVITVWGEPARTPGLTLPMEAGARVLPPPPISWLMATGMMRKLLFRQLVHGEKIGGGKSPMSLGPKGMLDTLFEQAGFKNIQRKDPEGVFRYQTLDEYWEVLMGTPARSTIEKFPPAKVAAAKAMIGKLLDQRHRAETGYDVPMGAAMVSGEV